MLVNEVQPEKALPPMWVTESGIEMLVSEVQPQKAPYDYIDLNKELQKERRIYFRCQLVL